MSVSQLSSKPQSQLKSSLKKPHHKYSQSLKEKPKVLLYSSYQTPDIASNKTETNKQKIIKQRTLSQLSSQIQTSTAQQYFSQTPSNTTQAETHAGGLTELITTSKNAKKIQYLSNPFFHSTKKINSPINNQQLSHMSFKPQQQKKILQQSDQMKKLQNVSEEYTQTLHFNFLVRGGANLQQENQDHFRPQSANVQLKDDQEDNKQSIYNNQKILKTYKYFKRFYLKNLQKKTDSDEIQMPALNDEEIENKLFKRGETMNDIDVLQKNADKYEDVLDEKTKTQQKLILQQNMVKIFKEKYQKNSPATVIQQILDRFGSSKYANKQVKCESKYKIIQSIKESSIKSLYEMVKMENHKEFVQKAEKQLEEFQSDVVIVIQHLQEKNDMLKQQLQKQEDQNFTLSNENQILLKENKVLQQRVEDYRLKNEQMILSAKELEQFRLSQQEFQKRFPGFTLEKLMDKHDYLVDEICKLLNQQNSLEDQKKEIEQDKVQLQRQFNDKMYQFGQYNEEKEKSIQNLRSQISEIESDKLQAKEYQNNYVQLFKKIIDIYQQWEDKIRVFSSKHKSEPHANLKDPIDILEYLNIMMKISTPQHLQTYLRKIIVRAYQLMRKYFPNSLGERFNTEEIFEMIDKYVSKLMDDNAQLKQELNQVQSAKSKSKYKQQKQSIQQIQIDVKHEIQSSDSSKYY